MPFVSYIRNSLGFWYYADLTTCCQNLEKKLGLPAKSETRRGVELLRDLTEKSINFSNLADFSIRLLIFLVKKINRRN